ncbi:MAG: DUF5320 domain-containing protein [Bacteroidetes bacterium]|nr:DUF5320 domain-containing protein [Bacteroidota bacterium]
MPKGDRTGPSGAGPMTGRAAGYCAGYTIPGYMNPIPGRGFGFGFGRGWGHGGFGRGWRHRYWSAGFPGWAGTAYAFPADAYPNITPKQEMDMLKQEADALKTQLDGILDRIKTLEKTERTADSDK